MSSEYLSRSERGDMSLSGTNFRIPDIKALRYFFETYCFTEVSDLANNWPDKASVTINYMDMEKFSRELSEACIECFPKVEPLLKKALLEMDLIRVAHDPNEIEPGLMIRVRGMPGFMRKSLRELGKGDIGKLISVDGFVRLASKKLPVYTSAAFDCIRCGHTTIVEQFSTKFEEPFACEEETCGKKGPFKIDITKCTFKDFQQVQIQELPDDSKGSGTADLLVELDEDLVNILEPGDKVTITGLLMITQRIKRDGKQNINDFVLQGVGVEKQDQGFDEIELSPEDEREIVELSENPDVLNMIRDSIAPAVYGYENIKDAISLQLFSGVKKVLPDGTEYRGNEHMIMIGDPGLAKSVLLRRAVKLSPRGIFTSGKTSSAAGLTAAAVKDPLNEGKWTFEGGAAVLANTGVLAIDEIGQAKDEDKSALHEVLEQQTVSINKAGMAGTVLRAAVACMAAGNPVDGYFDRTEPFAKQIGIQPALLSRFGLIFIMLDDPEEKRDRAVSGHMLNNHMIGGAIQNRKHSRNPQHTEGEISQMVEEIAPPIPEELLRKYIAYARMYVYPVTNPEVRDYIQNFYIDIRKMKVSQNCPVPITARDVEALQRLSEARARMRLSDVVTIADVDHAKSIIIASLKDVGFDPVTHQMDASIIATGKSHSMREKIKALKEAIKANGEQEAVYKAMEKNGVSVEDTEKLISKLREQGDIYFTGSFYKIINK